MVEFRTRVFNEDNNQIIGAEVLVYSDNGDKIGVIDIADATTLNELRQQLQLIDETYFTEERLNTILANQSETTVINATRLNGFNSSDFAKVSQLSNYAPASHTHTKNNITNLYDYEISASNYNPQIDTDITVTVTVRDSRGNLVTGHSVAILKNNASWASGNTNSNGQFIRTFNCSEWGIVDFSVGTVHCQVLVDGWRTLTGGNWANNERYGLFRNKTHAKLVLNQYPKDITTEWTVFGTERVQTTQYLENYHIKPTKNVFNVNPEVCWNARPDGWIYCSSVTGSNITGKTWSLEMEWPICDEDL